ncbi:MAG: 2-hydroxyacyl-CoA dehydratase [Deltaproteobacteria bacterium]|nr:2-hydroxyacyl-CoA dehydratase [Deltaproteobacteria bacterium]
MRVGFTTTIPVEVLYAGGHRPVDLNNVFITSPDPASFLRAAERDGFPRNCCGWIKGIYGVARAGRFRNVIAVTRGDCSFTQALMEVLEHRGVRVAPFAFPFDRNPDSLALEIRAMARRFGTTAEEAARWKKRLDGIREAALEIDRLTWDEGKVTGEENHFWLVNCSDFRGDPDRYGGDARDFLARAALRPGRKDLIPLAFAGVPPITSGIHAFFEEAGGRFVFNEVARQFAMPHRSKSLAEQYLLYTYPYSFFVRLSDIRREVRRRKVRGVVHYVQSFCFRQIEDILLREEVGLPVLTLEGDQPGPLDERTKIRIQAFVEMLRAG